MHQVEQRFDCPIGPYLMLAVVKLECGKSNPILKTLRSCADATDTRLRISFEPKEAR
jgi:hypothetical protein